MELVESSRVDYYIVHYKTADKRKERLGVGVRVLVTVGVTVRVIRTTCLIQREAVRELEEELEEAG